MYISLNINVILYCLLKFYLIGLTFFLFWMFFALLFWLLYLKLHLYSTGPGIILDTFQMHKRFQFIFTMSFFKVLFFITLKRLHLYEDYILFKWYIIDFIRLKGFSLKTIKFYIDCLLFKKLFTRGFYYSLTLPFSIIFKFLSNNP